MPVDIKVMEWEFKEGVPIAVKHAYWGSYQLDTKQMCLPVLPEATMFWAVRMGYKGSLYDTVELRQVAPVKWWYPESKLLRWKTLERDWNYIELVAQMCYVLYKYAEEGTKL